MSFSKPTRWRLWLLASFAVCFGDSLFPCFGLCAPSDGKLAHPRERPVTAEQVEPLRLPMETMIAKVVAFSPDGKTLALSREFPRNTSPREVIEVGTTILYNAATGEELRRLKVDDLVTKVERIVFSPDSRKVAIAYFRSLSLWDLASGSKRELLDGTSFHSDVQFSSNGKFLVGTAAPGLSPHLGCRHGKGTTSFWGS